MSDVTLRLATHADIPTLLRWDADPVVIASGSDDPDAVIAWGEDNDWAENIDLYQPDVWEYWIAELGGRPIGEADARGKGHGETMMRLAFARCFADPLVTAIIIDPLASNTRAHTFYQRLGFVPTHRQTFSDGEDDCLVHRLTRADWLARNNTTQGD